MEWIVLWSSARFRSPPLMRANSRQWVQISLEGNKANCRALGERKELNLAVCGENDRVPS